MLWKNGQLERIIRYMRLGTSMRKKTGTPKDISEINFSTLGKQSSLLVFVMTFAVIGIVVMLVSRAATLATSLEPEEGAIASPAIQGFDSSASGGKYTQFKVVPPPPVSGTWLSDFTSIKAAIDRGDPIVQIADGTYNIPIGQGLVVRTNGQKIIGQSDRGVKLVVQGNRGEMNSKGVIEIAANNVEIANLVLVSTRKPIEFPATDPEAQTQPVAGIWSEGNDYYLHDLHIDGTSFGMQLWKGSGNGGGLRRIHRVLVTNVGYIGQTFGHSGYGMYIQTPDVAGTAVSVQMEDLAFEEITRYALHDYASFNMDSPRVINGLAAINTGSNVATGTRGTPENVYLAKAANLEIHRGHLIHTHPQSPSLTAIGKIGYGSGFNPNRFLAADTWALNDPALPKPPSRWQNQTNLTWPGGFNPGIVTDFNIAADRAAFSGVKPLGPKWGVMYGPGPIPTGWEQLPGSIAYPSRPTNPAIPAVTVVRRTP